MFELPGGYRSVMALLHEYQVFGVVIRDAPILRDLVRLAWEITTHAASPTEAVRRIELLVLGNLAGTFTFNNVHLEMSEGFPDKFPPIEQERWYVGWRHGDVLSKLETIAPGRYAEESLRWLDTQIVARVGDCPVYAITFAILVASCDLCTQVMLVGRPPHAWVRCHVKGEEQPRHVDLSARSHGRFEEDKGDWYDRAFGDDETLRLTI